MGIQFFLPLLNDTYHWALTDGINEVGLMISELVMGSAMYENANDSTKSVSIGVTWVTAYLLGCCATVNEAAEALKAVTVLPMPNLGVFTHLAQVHFFGARHYWRVVSVRVQ